MRIRDVSKRNVAETISYPDFAYEDVESNALVAVSRIEGRTVIVIYTVQEGRNRVITVYHASEVDRLIRRKLERKAWMIRK